MPNLNHKPKPSRWENRLAVFAVIVLLLDVLRIYLECDK